MTLLNLCGHLTKSMLKIYILLCNVYIKLLFFRVQNKGSLSHSKRQITDGYADAQINEERGTVVCTTTDHWTRIIPGMLPEQSLHARDIALYFANLKDNAAKRIAAYLADHKQQPNDVSAP